LEDGRWMQEESVAIFWELFFKSKDANNLSQELKGASLS